MNGEHLDQDDHVTAEPGEDTLLSHGYTVADLERLARKAAFASRWRFLHLSERRDIARFAIVEHLPSGRVITMRDEPAADPATTTEDSGAGGLPGALSAPVNTEPGLLASQINDIQPWENGDQAGIRATAEIYGWHAPNRDQRARILAVLRDSELIWRGTAVDRVGRAEVAVSFDSDNGVSRDLLTLDPATGEPLAYELVTLRNPGRLTGPFPPCRTTSSSSTTIANVNSPEVQPDRGPTADEND